LSNLTAITPLPLLHLNCHTTAAFSLLANLPGHLLDSAVLTSNGKLSKSNFNFTEKQNPPPKKDRRFVLNQLAKMLIKYVGSSCLANPPHHPAIPSHLSLPCHKHP